MFARGASGAREPGVRELLLDASREPQGRRSHPLASRPAVASSRSWPNRSPLPPPRPRSISPRPCATTSTARWRERRVERTPEEWTEILKGYARSYGAVDAGIAELRPYHVYTNVGRGTGTYGESDQSRPPLGPRLHRRDGPRPHAAGAGRAGRRGVGPPVRGRRQDRAHTGEHDPAPGLSGAGPHRRQLPGHRPAGGARRRPRRDRPHGPADDAAAWARGCGSAW